MESGVPVEGPAVAIDFSAADEDVADFQSHDEMGKTAAADLRTGFLRADHSRPVVARIGTGQQDGAGSQVQPAAAPKPERADTVGPVREINTSAGVDRLLDRGGIIGHTVADSAEIKDIVHSDACVSQLYGVWCIFRISSPLAIANDP